MNTMEDFTNVRIKGLFDDSTEELPVARTILYNGSITYLEDGRYVIRGRRDGQDYIELRTENDELVRQIRDIENAYFMTDKGSRVLYSSKDTPFLLDVDTGESEMVELDPPKLITKYYLGADRDTLFCIGYFDVDIYKLHYVKETKKWIIGRNFEVIKHVGGGTGVITNLIFDDRETLFCVVRYPLPLDMYDDEDDEEETGNDYVVYSIDTATGDMKRLFKFDKCLGVSLDKMLTPSTLLVMNKDISRQNKMYAFDLMVNILFELKMDWDDTCFSPDGRKYINRIDRGIHFKMLRISPNGQRMHKIVSHSNTFCIELILEHPMLRPVYTHFYGKHHWIRLMSDMTIETALTWPKLGFKIIPTHDGLSSAGQHVKQYDETADFTLPIAIWSSADRTGTFEKAKRVYLGELVRAIAKVITSIK